MPDPFAAMQQHHNSENNDNKDATPVNYSRTPDDDGSDVLSDDDSANAAWKPEKPCRPQEISIVVMHDPKKKSDEQIQPMESADDDDELHKDTSEQAPPTTEKSGQASSQKKTT